jgi:branched-chain amino acid transport system permease protein
MNLAKWSLWGTVGFLIFLGILLVNQAGFISNFIVYTFLFVIAGLGWNLLGGYIGEISFGHAVFFGVGAYCVGLPVGYKLNIPLPLLVLLGGVVSGLLAAVLSYPLLRMRGFPFLIATFGLGVVFERVFHISKPLFSTRGIFIPAVNTYLLYAAIGAIAFATIVGTRWLVGRDIGLSFKAIRDAPDAARMVGINLFKTKMTAFVIGAFLTGIAGGLFALYRSFVNPPTCFSMNISLTILLGPYIGGIGTVLGTAIGAFVVMIIEEVAREWFVEGHYLFLGAILIVIMLTMKEGIYPTLLKLYEERRRKSKLDINAAKA